MRRNNKKNLAIIQNIVCMLPFLFILAMFIVHLALPDKTFSKEERRYLAQWPVFHIEKVLDGSYANKVKSYFSDQFPFRNFWVHIHKGSNQILLQGEDSNSADVDLAVQGK
ncbi:DHHW family protein [Desulforamulus aeronauticus]|uniref:DHHW protein n=1 Tax=Desulforamulus aeronauticus DSM 10349 TaxID=1121421 RepID=A0A1M6Q1J2_9FIRM|nr:DHHW family protein [Desulforamulus aeronauticus]SHK14007.1 DHHW protein [Desulforamulus aeronauticus DSM 10349]